jgi:anaerobic magnesium-protoporphyrin IX monomethyl ester cyclase
MKVLLVHAHAEARTTAGYYRRFLAPMPPITLAYLAAVLERAGVDVSVYDDALAGGDPARFEAELRARGPDVVGLSVVTAAMPAVERLAGVVRAAQPGATIVMGNIHADVFASAILEAGLADVVVHGEGEVTVVELVEALASDAVDLSGVEGVSYRRDGQVVTTAPRPPIEDLDALPFPAWHLFEFERYRLFNFARVREPGTLVLGSRGCPYGCTYCSLRIMGARRRARSASNIADEFEYLYDRFGIRQPSFTDPIFPFDRGEGLAFADELIRRGLHRKQVWITETRTDRVDRELLEAMSEAGLRRIMFGFEAGTHGELAAIRKGVSADEGFEAVRAARAAGLQIIGFFMLGIPGSDRAALQQTIDYARALDVDFAKFTVFVPFPGTPVHAELLAAGRLDAPRDWERYTSYPTREVPPCYVPDGLTAEDLIEAQRRAYAAFYLRPRMAWRHLVRIRALTPGDAWDGVRALAERI